jgi:hypothetical protein
LMIEQLGEIQKKSGSKKNPDSKKNPNSRKSKIEEAISKWIGVIIEVGRIIQKENINPV